MGSGSARRNFGIGAGRFAGTLVVAAVLGAPAAGAECAADVLSIRGTGAEAQFRVELADEPAEQARGLMGREKMASSAGMLFIFPAPKHASFWMHDTLIPLDMLFIDETGRVKVVKDRAQPLDESIVDGGEGVKFVLEINGGLAAAMGLGPGAVIRHPAVDQALAAWPCGA